MKQVKRFEFKRNEETGEMWVETDLHGKSLLTLASLNKGTAFSEREREEFGLLGKLPYQIESLEEQKHALINSINLFAVTLAAIVF